MDTQSAALQGHTPLEIEMLDVLREAYGWIDAQITTANDVSEYDIEVVNRVKAIIAKATR